MMYNNKPNAFTLVELSLVLLIISLIIGGTMAGKSLITNAKIRSLISESGEYPRAVDNFRNIIVINGNGCFPGDCASATAVFGTTDVNGSTVNNGDGNGFIGDNTTNNLEDLGAWQHLALAGIINGVFTGNLVAAPTSKVSVSVNAPGSNYDPNLVYLFYSDTISSNYVLHNAIAACTLGSNTACHESVYVNDIYAVDVKVDDGLPFTGRILAFSGTVGNCTSAAIALGNHTSATYLMAAQPTTCKVLFALTGFIYS